MLPRSLMLKLEALNDECYVQFEKEADLLLTLPHLCRHDLRALRRVEDRAHVLPHFPRPRPAKARLQHSGFFQMGPDLRLRCAGATMQLLLRLTAPEILGDKWQTLFVPDELERLAAKWARAAMTQTGFVHTFWCFTGDGDPICLRERVKPHVFAGVFLGWTGYVRKVPATTRLRISISCHRTTTRRLNDGT